MSKRIDKATKAKVRSLYSAGYYTREIAAKLDLTEAQVVSILGL